MSRHLLLLLLLLTLLLPLLFPLRVLLNETIFLILGVGKHYCQRKKGKKKHADCLGRISAEGVPWFFHTAPRLGDALSQNLV